MGAPNNGPFSYISGSLQLYTEALNFKSNNSELKTHSTFINRSDFINSISKMDSTIQYQAKSFAKRTTSSYKDFRYEVYSNGLHVFKATKPGNVPGSYAEYVKILYKDGTIRAVYKDTIDNHGHNVHRHIKWPAKEI